MRTSLSLLTIPNTHVSTLTARLLLRNENEKKLTEYTWGDYDSGMKYPVMTMGW